MGRTAEGGGHAVAEVPKVMVGIDALILERDSEGVAAFEGEGIGHKGRKRLGALANNDRVASDATIVVTGVGNLCHI